MLFVEVKEPGLSASFRLLYQRMRKSGCYCVHTHFLHNGTASGLEYIRRCSVMLKDLADAKYVFLNDGCNVIGSIPMRKDADLACVRGI